MSHGLWRSDGLFQCKEGNYLLGLLRRDVVLLRGPVMSNLSETEDYMLFEV
jgi:hypothetical protein